MTASPHPDADELAAQVRGVRELVARLVRDGSVAEDVAQDAWLASLRTAKPQDVPISWWLAGIARNLARRFGRGESRRARRERAAARVEATEPTVDIVARAEVHRGLVGAVLALEEPYRTTLLLRFFDDLTCAEIGRRLGVPAATIRSRSKRGLDLLRSDLDRQSRGGRREWALGLSRLGRWSPPLGLPMAGALIVKTSTKVAAAAALCLLVAAGILVAPQLRTDRTAAARSSEEPAAAASKRAPPVDLPPAAVHGVVRRSDTTRVVEGATVTLRAKSADRSARADAAGAFRFDAVPARVVCRVTAEASGCRASSPVVLEPVEGANLDAGTLWVDPEARVEVIVRSRADEPVSGARVDVLDGWDMSTGPGWSALERGLLPSVRLAVATTGADGTASFRDLPFGEVRVVASKDGFATAASYRRLPLDEPIVLRLAEGHALAGRVLDSSGRGVAGATVAVEGPARAQTTSGEDGTYALAGLPRGDFTVKCARAGAIPVIQRSGKVRVPDVGRYDVELRDAAVLTGVVTDEATGLPLAGATVRAWSMGQTARAITDAQGRYVLDGLFECVVGSLDATLDGYVLDLPEGTDPAKHWFAIRGGATTVRNFVLRRGARLSGFVLGPDGPVPGATVWAVVRNGYVWEHATTDGAGRYAFATLDAGKARVWAEKPDGWSFPDGPADPRDWERTAVAIPRQGAVTKDLRLVRNSAMAQGRVVTADGAPVEGATVGYAANATRTGPDGAFRVEGLATAREAWIDASKPGFVEARRKFDLSDGHATGLVLRLERCARVSGTVRDAANAPLGDAVVEITAITDEMRPQFGGGSVPYVVSVRDIPVRSDGSFESALAWSGGGTLRIAASASGGRKGQAADLKMTAGRDEYGVDVDLSQGVTVEGRVIDEETGEGIAGAVVLDESGAAIASADERGRFTARGVHGPAAGPWNLTATAPGFAIAGHVAIEETSRSNATLRLVRGLEISGVVRFSDGTPAAGAGVAADRDFGSYLGAPADFGVAGSDGRFRLRGLTRGAHSLHVTVPQRVEMDLRPFVSEPVEAGTSDVVLVVQHGAVLSGTVRDAEGKPLSGIAVTATPRDGRGAPSRAVTAADGGYRVTGLEDGLYDLVAARDPYPNVAPLLPVRRAGVAAGTSGIDFVLAPSLSIAGIVVDTEGRPVAGFTIAAAGHFATTGDDGRFTIEGLAAGPCVLRIPDPDAAWVIEAGATTDAGARDVRVTVRRRP